MVYKTDAKVEAIQQTQQNQAADLALTISEITNMRTEMEALNQQSVYANDRIDMLYLANESHENCIALALMVNQQSVLANEFGRSEETQENLYKNDKLLASFYGRLYVPDAKIDVALYRGYQQYICDRYDSANLFTWGVYDGEYIADHSTQEFRKLFSVEVGMTGYIKLENGDIINIICTEVTNGHNTGAGITDEYGNSDLDADYVMYTCRNGWQNIRLCLWKEY